METSFKIVISLIFINYTTTHKEVRLCMNTGSFRTSEVCFVRGEGGGVGSVLVNATNLLQVKRKRTTGLTPLLKNLHLGVQ